jgi:ribosome biogenesis ATPase
MRALPLSPEQLSLHRIITDDFLEAAKIVQPSAKREGFATIPDTKWEDIGALEALHSELDMAIFQPIVNPDQFTRCGTSHFLPILTIITQKI